MRSVKLRTPALAAAVLALLTATVPAAGAAPAGRATATTTAWRIQPTPNPKIPQGRLNAVSCSSPRTCTAVGVFDNIPGRGTLAERWDGTSWSIQASANPAGALTAVLFGVSCPAATFCVAVGNYQNRTGRHTMFAEAWNGSSWSVLPAPPPAGARRSFLNGVSCTSATACTAVGSYQTGAGQHVTLAERWNGTTWSIQPTPNGPAGNFLTGVSCPAPAACIAVGGSNGAPLAEAWNGISWSIQPTPSVGRRNTGAGATSQNRSTRRITRINPVRISNARARRLVSRNRSAKNGRVAPCLRSSGQAAAIAATAAKTTMGAASGNRRRRSSGSVERSAAGMVTSLEPEVGATQISTTPSAANIAAMISTR